jgi:mannose-6-phosphate isomerase-like protein (cupin superfamily)
MKKLKTREHDSDCRIVGKFNGGTVAIARAVTKEVLPFEQMHSHQTATEYYIFLKGKAEMIVNGDVISITKGDVLVIEPGEAHKLNKVLEEIDYIAIRDSVDDNKVVFVEENMKTLKFAEN